MSQSQSPKPPYRRVRAYVSNMGTTQMHLRSPAVIALWSAIFPGLGHLLLSKYISGMILFIWEVVINLMSHMNLSIYYTFTGQFEMAKSVLDKQWLLLYVPTYLFAIWDSYRSTVDTNLQFILAAHEDAPVAPFSISAMGHNQLDKSPPWVSMMWSMISPGVGQLMIHRILVAFFLLTWWIVVAFQSKLLPAIHFTLLGQFNDAKAIADKQWILNIPSIFFFAIYDAYANTVESNKLFEWEQAKFFRKEFQAENFRMPFYHSGELKNGVYIVSSFEQSIHLETAIASLLKQGVQKTSILALPMDKKNDGPALFDRIHASDRKSMLDFPIILAALFSLFGLIYGFLLHWGPVLWALIGTGAGFGIGVIIKLFINRLKKAKRRSQPPEVVLLVDCVDVQPDIVQNILWSQGALGMSRIGTGKDAS